MTCLVESFKIKNYLDKLSIFELDNFLNFKTVSEQFKYLLHLALLPLKMCKGIIAENWKQVEEFCKNEIKDGILLMWGSEHKTGHAVPVTNGKIEWLAGDTLHVYAKFLTNISLSYIKPKY